MLQPHTRTGEKIGVFSNILYIDYFFIYIYKDPLIAVLDNQVITNPDSVCLKERVDALKKYKLLC